uniref:Helicase c-terminal domain containing protein n=1 Tax=Daphnia magna TaxID=35525 RepID=A0A0P5WIL7_9CRUS
MKTDEKNFAESSNVPTPKSLNNSDDVIEEIRSWIQLDVKSKFHEDAVKFIESVVVRHLSSLENTVVERLYVKVVLEMWLRKSLGKTVDYLNDETIDISVEMPTLLKELNSINSFEDIGLKLNEATCQLTNLCDAGCQYLELILDQVDLFKNTSRFSVLVASYFKQFKASCIDKVFSRCLDDVGKDQTNGKRNRELIVALNALLQVASEDVGIQNVLEKNFTGKDVKDFDDANGKDLINQLVEIFASCRDFTKNESSEWLNYLKSEKEWAPKLQVLVKETCKPFLFPKTTIEITDEYGRKIIFIKGVSVFVSKMIEEMKRLKENNPEVQEIQMVGLSSVHIDCHLENKTWHGTNVGIVADKIFVDYEVCRKGHKSIAQAKEETTEPKAAYNFVDDFCVCWDISGENGEPGRPGTSGGKVHIICNEMFGAEQWKIISDGGDGGDGKNGTNGEANGEGKPDRKASKWSKEYFNQAFPSMSIFETGEQTEDKVPDDAIQTVLTTLNDLLPVENRKSGKDILSDYRGNFFIDGTAKDGSKITVSYYQSKTKKHTLVLCQGSSIGQGGSGGTMIFECMTGKNSFAFESSVPVVGKENRQPRAVRMGVYQAMGSNGATGTPVGDVGFIHRLDTSEASANKNQTGHYIGFENDVRLRMEHDTTKPTRQPNDPDNYYAKLRKGEYASIAYHGLSAYGQVQPLHSVVVNATKKKGIIRQSLARHFFQVDERKQMTQSLQEKLYNDWEEQKLTEDVDFLVSQMEDKETQLYQVSSQCSRGLENIGSMRFVKPALKKKLSVNKVSDTSRSLVGRRSVGRRPVDFRQKPVGDVRCLDMLPTMSGVDSAIHSIFGQMNSSGLYVCNNVKMFRQHLATFIRQNKTSPTYPKEPSNRIELVKFTRKKEKHDKVLAFVKQFVLRVQESNALDYPVAFDMKNAYFEFRRTNSEENEFLWQNASECQKLFEEYAKFVETPSNSLELSEMEILAIIHAKTIHVYNDQLSSFTHNETLNPSSYNKQCILHRGHGEWQRVEPNIMMENYCEQIDEAFFEYQPIQTHYFRKFLDLLKKHGAKQQVIDSLKTLDPENGDTPDKLFQLLLKTFQENEESGENLNVKLLDEYSIDLCWLAEWIAEHNNRNLSPIFYLNIINNVSPVDWRCDFVMLEIYDRFSHAVSDIIANSDIQHWLYKIAVGMPSLVPLLRKSVATSDNCAALQPQKLLRLMELIATDFEQDDGITSQQLPELELLPLSDWYHFLKSKMWEKKVNRLPIGESSSPKENKKLKNEAVYMLLELEFKNNKDFCDELLKKTVDLKTAVFLLQNNLYPGVTPSQEHNERNIDNIINKMKKDAPTNDKLIITKVYPRTLTDVQTKVKESKSMSDQMKESDEHESKQQERIKKLIKQWQTNGLELNDNKSMVDFVFVYDYAVQKTCTKDGDKQIFRLRDTQRITIMTLLTSDYKNTLTQVSTGEGKSLIVTGVAIAFALCRNEDKKNKKIDVITSNDVLARRDSTLSVADGGLRNLYEYFNVSVANNCSQWVDERTQAYNAAVVYGQLANFQRDYLLDEFYGHSIRGDRTMDLVVIDEVDCMLLDRGNNTLYLSHDIPGMEMLESLYVFIWEKIRSSSIGSDKFNMKESVKSAVLYDLYGAISKDDLESIHNPLKDQPSEKNALWDHLIETKVIDPQGRLLMEDKIETINFKPQLDPKIIFYLRNVSKRERNIRIPEHLMSFVDRHLDNWLDNAMQALELKRDEDYVVDQDRTDTSPDLHPQVIIIDQDTGMDQISSQWDGALHQFIQLKEGCKLTSQNLKSIFISNATYIQAYKKAAGVSGTLGSETERQFMHTKYKSLQFVIPTAFQKCFYLKPTQVFKSKDHWLHAIVKETQQIIQPEDQAKARSLVIFCQSIKDVNVIRRYLKNALGSKLNDNHIHCYTRDYEKFAFEGKSLEIGHVIVATNLAGRGTDIKISEELRENGGLHICLTFLPKNERIEEQAMGRSARNGAPGSGTFLLYEESPTGNKWDAGKWLSMKEERQWREKQRISRLQEDFRTMEHEQNFFDELSIYYTELKQELKNQKREDQAIKTICDSVLDIWALWLDQTEDHLKLTYSYHHDFLKHFRTGLGLPDNNMTDNSWMTPVRSVTLAKHLALQKSSLSEASEILKRVIDSRDSDLYPAAHYYFAFVLIQEDFKENRPKFIQILQNCETILSNDIDMHLSFYRKVALATADQTPSFCVVDAYKQQKDNIVKILEYFIGSARALIGSHYCSASNLKEAGKEEKKEKTFLKKAEIFLQNIRLEFVRFQKERKSKCKSEQKRIICPEQADKLFELLVEKKCITCRLNDTDTIPNRDAIIQQVANEHGIKKDLKDNLESVFGQNFTEKQVEKNLKKENLIPCTRKAFWEELRKEGALQAVKGGLCSQMNCVIVLDSECDVEPSSKLNSKKLSRENRIKIEDFQFGLDSFDHKNNCLNVLYNPIYDNMKDLLKQNKIMFSKRYVIERLGKEEYRRRKENFELNQIAQLNLNKLETVTLKFCDPLEKDDFTQANIISNSERDCVWKALIDQQIIDSNGELSSNYQKFSYPECPAYEQPVMRVIARIFVAEIVKRQWLRAAKDPKCLKAINLLPLKPYRDLLGDLMAAHVISGARVTEDATLIEKETKEIEDEDERECVRRFLKSRQAIYAPRMKKYEIFLDLIEMDIRKIPNTVNISTELHTFDLAAFNHVIDIKDGERSWKSYLGATFAGVVGVASIGVGIFLLQGKMLSFGFNKNVLLMGGASDILYAITTILTHSKFTWADYTRQRLRSVMGKTEPIEMIKTIYKLYDLSENADFRKAINLAIGLERWTRQNRDQINKGRATLLGRGVEKIVLVNHQTELHFHIQLHYLLQDFGSFILGKTKKLVTKNLTEIQKALTQFNELHGTKTSQHFIRGKLNKLISQWATEGQKWVCEIIDETTLKLNEIAGTGGIPLTQEMANKGIRLMEPIFNDYEVRMKLIRITVTCIREFLLGLENHANPEDPIAKNIDVEEFKRFPKKMMADIDSELGRQVEKILNILRQQIHQVTSDQISRLANVNSEMFTTLSHLM